MNDDTISDPYVHNDKLSTRYPILPLGLELSLGQKQGVDRLVRLNPLR